jgi:hypothetical protein
MNYKGKFRPNNRQKYKGDITNIIYRSLWERSFMRYCDENKDIVEWGSEELIVPYISPLDNKQHRYFPDFYIKTKNGDKFMVEIKPKKFTRPPKPKKRVTKAYMHETKEWHRNQAKWKAAKNVCEKLGWKFQIITEDHLKVTKYLYGR